MFDFLNRRLEYMADGIREGVTDLGTFTVIYTNDMRRKSAAAENKR